MNRSIQRIFSEVPHTYELVNHILTLGLDIILRRRAARFAVSWPAPGTRPGKYLDICSGTGELARSLAQSVDEPSIIIALDFCHPMLAQGINKLRNVSVSPVLADVGVLPFPADTFDAVTISFATRNININRKILLNHLREVLRVLKPQGKFINLETSQPDSNLLRRFFHSYVKIIVRSLGRFISGSHRGYTYLARTIPRFYKASEFSDILYQVGFSRVRLERQYAGIAAIHIAAK